MTDIVDRLERYEAETDPEVSDLAAAEIRSRRAEVERLSNELLNHENADVMLALKLNNDDLRARNEDLEAKLAAIEAQEPVAWKYRTYTPESDAVNYRLTDDCDEAKRHDQFPVPLYASPVADKDAERYRWLKNSNCLSYTSDTGPSPSTPMQRMEYALEMYGKQTSDMIEIRLLCYHLGPHDEPIWIDGEHFDYAANMDAAIDAAMAKGE